MSDAEEPHSSTDSEPPLLHRIGKGLTGSVALISALASHLLIPIAGFELTYLARTALSLLPGPIFSAIISIIVLIVAYLVWILPVIFTAYSVSFSQHVMLPSDWDQGYAIAVLGVTIALLIEATLLVFQIVTMPVSGLMEILPYALPGYGESPGLTVGIWLLFLIPMAYLSLSDLTRPIRRVGTSVDNEEPAQTATITRNDNKRSAKETQPLHQTTEELSFPWRSPPETTFTDIGNYTETLKEIRQSVIRPLVTSNQAYERFGVTPARGILLYGPPGTGKTHLARGIAGELGYPYIELSGGNLKSKWLNESTQNVASLFREAESFEECVIFIDEIDSLLADRSDSLHQEHAQVVNEFLAQLEDSPEFLFIAATNRPERLDAAATRRGRFDQQFEIGKPDQAGRRAILQVQLRGKPAALSDAELTELAATTKGLTGADLAGMVADASRRAAEADAEAIRYEHLADAQPTHSM